MQYGPLVLADVRSSCFTLWFLTSLRPRAVRLLGCERGDETEGAGRGGAAGCDTVAGFYREYLYSGSTRLLRSQTELRDEENVYETLGWEGGRGRELFCVWVFVHCQRINKKKWRSSLSFTNTTWGRERRRGLQLWFYSELKKKKKNDIQYGRHGGAVDQEGHGFDSGPGTFLCGVYSHYGLFVSCPGSPLSSHCRLL